jgi:hypothetical protein
MPTCPKCFEVNPPGAKTCRQCKADLERTATTCLAGLHTMDPTWTECAYCKAEGRLADSAPTSRARRETVVESPAGPGGRRETVVESSSSSTGRRETVVESGFASSATGFAGTGKASGSQRRKTEFYAPPAEPASEGTDRPRAAGRKIVGVLITYTWNPDGQIFPVREGRNWIGRDPEKCDIAVLEDETLSAINSHITFRKNFVIGDNVSMSGTDVNGEPVEEQFHPLENYATVRTGATHWIFIVASPGQSSAPGK